MVVVFLIENPRGGVSRRGGGGGRGRQGVRWEFGGGAKYFFRGRNARQVSQDKFDRDKGQKSAISGAVSTGGSPLDFLLFLQFLCAI